MTNVATWARTGLAAQVVFLAAWLLAGLWQGPRYDPLRHTISDMYAVGAPHGWFLVGCITLAGAGTVLFALLGVRPALRQAGWPATVGALLLAVSILGLGDLLTPFEREGCRLADPGCTAAAQVANSGGRLDAILSGFGVLFLIACGFFLAEAMKRLPGWRTLAWPARWSSIALIVLATLNASPVGGLFERLLAAAAALAVAGLALAVVRRAT